MTERSVSGSKTGWRWISRKPSRISSLMGVADVRGGRDGSLPRIRISETADTVKEIASTRIASGGPIAWTSPPARPGPPISAMEELGDGLPGPQLPEIRVSPERLAGHARQPSVSPPSRVASSAGTINEAGQRPTISGGGRTLPRAEGEPDELQQHLDRVGGTGAPRRVLHEAARRADDVRRRIHRLADRIGLHERRTSQRGPWQEHGPWPAHLEHRVPRCQGRLRAAEGCGRNRRPRAV